MTIQTDLYRLHLATAMRLQSRIASGRVPEESLAFVEALIRWVEVSKRTWSDRQEFYANKLDKEFELDAATSRMEAKEAKQAKAAPMHIPNIAAMFNLALAHKLSWPKITIAYKGQTYIPVVISYNMHHNCIQFKIDKKLKATFKMLEGPNAVEDSRWPIKEDSFREWIKWVEANPTEAAKVSGKLTNQCCFCNRALTDERSVIHGYGPVCAQNFGLPWDISKEEEGSTLVEVSLAALREEGL